MRILWITALLWPLFEVQFAFAADKQSAAQKAATATDWYLTGLVSAAILLVAVAALIIGLRRVFLRREHGSLNNPRRLLHELCQAHGLSRRAERLLRKAALALETPHPGRFFLEPELLLAAQNCEQLRGNRRALGLLFERLFGENAG